MSKIIFVGKDQHDITEPGFVPKVTMTMISSINTELYPELGAMIQKLWVRATAMRQHIESSDEGDAHKQLIRMCRVMLPLLDVINPQLGKTTVRNPNDYIAARNACERILKENNIDLNEEKS